VERIEIVRGPRASYWGSDALGGVIQVFTRKLDGPRVAVGYGSYGDAAGSVGIGNWNGDDGYSVQVGARHVDGFSATNPGVCNGPDDPFCIYNPDDDAFRKTNLTARAAHRFGSQLLSGSFLRSQGQSQFDEGYSDIIQQVSGLELEGELGANWNHRLALGYNREDLETPAFGALYLTRRSSLLWQNEVRLDDSQRLVAGLDFVHEEAETRDTFAGTARYRDSRNNQAAFAGWRAGWGTFDAEISARHDHNSAFGGASTGSVAFGWRAVDDLRLHASFGQGFRSPSMNELYDPGYGGYFAGNPELDPERSHSSEVGLEWQASSTQQFGINAYSTRVRDLVSFTGPQSQAINVAHAAIDGAELSWQLAAGAWSARANWTWQDARDEDTDTRLLRRARQKGSAVVERAFGPSLRVGAEVFHNGRRDDVGGVELGAYTLLNLRANWMLSDAWSIGARLENLTDRHYELVRGYNTPGRSGFVDVTWHP
jgi:vitamin B12 transporter